MRPSRSRDVVIIGGGFYGCSLALYMRSKGRSVTILEQQHRLMQGASYVNQARIHNGYHYPRNILTATRSHANFRRFLRDFPYAVYSGFAKIYAVARNNTRITSQQFHDFCAVVGAPLRDACPAHRDLFSRDLIEHVFEVREVAFDSVRLRQGLANRLTLADVDVVHGFDVQRVVPASRNDGVLLCGADGSKWHASQVFACVYAQTNRLLRASSLPTLPLKHELAELAIVQSAPVTRELGITVVDGPFFSTMPFPSANASSFSHVRYTPHHAWRDDGPDSPDKAPRRANSLFVPMLRDAVRFVPSLAKTVYMHSLWTTKTTLADNELDDGRPIMLRRHHGIPNFHVVLGGKIDNIYDLMVALTEGTDEFRHATVETNDTLFEELFNGADHGGEWALGRKAYGLHSDGHRAQ